MMILHKPDCVISHRTLERALENGPLLSDSAVAGIGSGNECIGNYKCSAGLALVVSRFRTNPCCLSPFRGKIICCQPFPLFPESFHYVHTHWRSRVQRSFVCVGVGPVFSKSRLSWPLTFLWKIGHSYFYLRPTQSFCWMLVICMST